MQPARPEDAERIDAYLTGRSDTAMFLRSSLRDHGPCGGEGGRASRMWLTEDRGAVTGVLGLSNAGYLLVALPPETIGRAVLGALAGTRIRAIVGPTAEVRAVRAALGLGGVDVQRCNDEPLLRLDLRDLQIPPGRSTLRLAGRDDLPLLTDWRHDFLREVFDAPASEAAVDASNQVTAMVDCGAVALLENGRKPFCVTAFNAVLPDAVQVGNVYTPPRLRGRRYARRAVALHLDQARRQGVGTAVLSAANYAAQRSYEALGFRTVGSFTYLLFGGAREVGIR